LQSENRYQSLDAIRGLAAFGVVVFHYANHFSAAPYLQLLAGIYKRGAILVDVFFVMSGYLLATIYAGRRDFLALTWRRVARLAPLHWLMLALVTILQAQIMRRHGTSFVYLNNDAYHFLLNLLMLQCAGLETGYSFDGPAWSIGVEWLVNLLLFALLASGFKRTAWLAGGLSLLAALALWKHGNSLLALGLYKGFLNTQLLRGVAGFFMGAALTGLFPLTHTTSSDDAPWQERLAAPLWDVVAVLSFIALRQFMRSDRLAFRPGVDFAVALFIIPALIVGSVHGRFVPRLLALAPLQWLGRISYSMYLVHFPIQIVFVLLYPPQRWLDYSKPSVFAAYLAATLVTAYLTYRFVELPAQSLLQRVTLKPKRAAARQVVAVPSSELTRQLSGAVAREPLSSPLGESPREADF
jgi:peptidoglycan/LPS O-acetylase OafA/YrhL